MAPARAPAIETTITPHIIAIRIVATTTMLIMRKHDLSLGCD
jgi:hypothetical protein